ncbi:hypothetical protein H072_9906 [Dactylellina haptotyla CBS 200.50]|uniref:Pentacotripeptide-repeat region of PRORP domain-containing protein n=1 Tax=Dactylellina haptotyla (strain CBS 200.50) TaxID=1284197 RepID=S8A636_DACHA|nr:hypothetical protein H072_9906 [Dactylellina haptotyla CBS 200.50]
MLHSTFWVHSGESLLLDQYADIYDETETLKEKVFSKIRKISSALSIQADEFSKFSASQFDPHNRPSSEPISTISAFGLDFLYPPKAVALLQRLSVARNSRNVNTRSPFPRAYSSLIGDSAKARSEMKSKEELDRENDPEFEHAPSGMSKGLFDKRRRRTKGKWMPQEKARTLQTMNPDEFDLSEYSFDLAWAWYFEEQGAPVNPKMRLAPNSQRRRLLLDYLTKSKRRIDFERIIPLLEEMDPSGRTLSDCKALVKAYLHFGQVDSALEALKKLVDEYIGNTQAGFEEFFAYCIKHEMWDRALTAWDLLQINRPISNQVIERKGDPRYSFVDSHYIVTAVDGFPQKYVNWLSNQLKSDSRAQDFSVWLAVGIEKEYSKFDESVVTDADIKLVHEALIRKKWHRNDLVDLEYRILAKPFHSYHKDVIQDYIKYRETPDPHPSNLLLYRVLIATMRLSDFETMQMIFDDWFKYHRHPLANAYKIVLDLFAKRGEARIVEELYHQFTVRFEPTADDYRYILRAYIERGELTTAVERLEGMSQMNLEPSLACYNTILRGFAKSEDMETAMDYLNIILEKGFNPDHNTYGSMMYVCAARGDYENVDLLFRAACKNLRPSITMWSMVVWAHVNGGARSLAWKLIHWLYRTNIGMPLTHIYNMLMSAYANKKELDTVNKIFKEMQDRQIPFDFYSYCIMMRALAQTQHKENLQRARQMLDLLTSQGVETNATPYFVLMQGYLRRRKYADVFAIYSNMLENNIEPNFGVQSMLLLASVFEAQELAKFTGSVDLSHAEQISRIAIEKFSGFDPTSFSVVKTAIPTEVFTPLISAYIYKEDYDSVRRTYQNYLEISTGKDSKNMKPSMNMYLKLLHAAQRERNWVGLREVWEIMYREAQRRSRPLAEISTGKNVVTVMKREMCPAFDIMLKAAIDSTKKVDDETGGVTIQEIGVLMQQMLTWGFELDGGNWNSLIVLVALNGDLGQAFMLAEKQLVREEAQDYNIKKQKRFGFVGFAKHAAHPHLQTLEVLAGQLNGLIDRARGTDEAEAGKARSLIKLLSEETPVIWKLANITRRRGNKSTAEEFHTKLMDFTEIVQSSQFLGPKISHRYNVAPFSVRKQRFLDAQNKPKVDVQLGDLDYAFEGLGTKDDY